MPKTTQQAHSPSRRKSLILGVRPRDADAPGFYDLTLDLERTARALAGEPSLREVRLKLGLTAVEAIREHTPGAYLDPATSEVSINEGYDAAFDAGRLEHRIWDLVVEEVRVELRDLRPATRLAPTATSEPAAA